MSLTELHETTRRMMAAESVTDVAAIVQSAAERLLDGTTAAVVLPDGDERTVYGGSEDEFEAVSRDVAEHGLEGSESITVDRELAGEPHTFFAHALGDQGTLLVGRDATTGFSTEDRELLRILATNAEVALDRAVQLRILRDRETELVDERNRLAALFENIPSPTASFVIEDGEPVVESVNSAFERVFGYTQAELEGEHIDDYIVPPDREDEAEQYNTHLEQGKNVNVEVMRLTTDGPRNFLLDVVPFRLNAPNVHGYAMYTDITERKRREQELERQNERLEQFASIVSHDIRNPLNVAQGFVDVARDDPKDEYFDRIDDALDRVDDIVESILTLARHGRTVTEPEPTNLADTIDAAWRNVATGDATLERHPDTDRELYGDGTRITTLFENLFRNAIDHVGPTVTVTVGLLEDESGFYVTDDGPGIPEENRERVFESGFTTRTDGTGYGLAIVGEVVDAHDWDVRLGDQADGARFEVRGVEWVDDQDTAGIRTASSSRSDSSEADAED